MLDERIWNIRPRHPDWSLAQSFPIWVHHEENRQARIRHWNYHHPDGWLPCGDNWWDFPLSEHQVARIKKSHEETTARLRAQGWVIYD